MKSPEDILLEITGDKYHSIEYMKVDDFELDGRQIKALVVQSQKDAYNQAIEDVASKTIKLRMLDEEIINKTVILSLKIK